MSVAGHVPPNHLAFGQESDEDGDRDGRGQDCHQELPVVAGMVLVLGCRRVWKKAAQKLTPCSVRMLCQCKSEKTLI